jgi:hypothetical protein
LITTQQRILCETPTGLQIAGHVTPNSGTPNRKEMKIITQQDIKMMLGRGLLLKELLSLLLFSFGFIL